MSSNGGEDEPNDGELRAPSREGNFGRVFRARFDHLMRTIPGPSGVLWTNLQFAEALTERGVSTSRNYVAQLRTRDTVNPSGRLLAAIADLLAIKVDYFFDDRYAQALDQDLKLLSAIRTAGTERITLRASGLSPTGMREVENIIDAVRRIEGLPDSPQVD